MTTVPEEAVKAEVQLDPNAVIAAVRECARITAPDVTDAEFEALRADNDPLYANTTRDMERAIRAYLSALPFLPVQGAVKKLESSAARQLALEEAAKIADAKAGEYEREAEATDAYVSESDIRLCRAIAVRLRGVAAAIRALSSPDHADAGKVEGEGWLPIESAPKDGECVLVWKPDEPRVGEYICVAYWDDAIIKRTPQWVDVAGRALGFLSKVDGKPQGYPTHWRHLPSAPSQEVAGS